MKPPSFAPEQIQELGPPCYEVVARPDWTDRNQHVNIRWFMVIFDDAGDVWYPAVGLGDAEHRGRNSGTMDLEHHLNYIREVHPGDRLSVYMRLVGVTAKRIHYVMFLWNESANTLAAMFECVNTFVDLGQRKSAPWPSGVRSKLEELLEKHKALAWPAPVSGAMSA